MASIPYQFIEFNKENFSDYISRYDVELNLFLKEFEDNTEALFIDYQINNYTYHKKELSEFIRNIDFTSESRNEYLQFLENRVLFSNDQSCNEEKTEIFENEEYKKYSFYHKFLVEKRSSVFKILEFLESKKELLIFDKKENFSNSKITSNANKKEITLMPWFIVGVNIANGEIQKYDKEKLSNGRIAENLGLKYSDGPYISKSKLLIPCRGERSRNNIFNYPDKIKEIYIYCVNNGIHMIPEFEKIAEKYL